MAEIRKIVRSNPLSNYRQVAPSGGGAFDLLATAAETAYERLAPAAAQEMQKRATEEWRAYGRQQMGDPANPVSMSGMASRDGISDDAAAAFSRLEGDWGQPLRVTSAFRDPAKNAAVGGAKGSQHMHGNAFDVDVSDLSQEQRVDLIKRARAAGFRGVGVYDNSLHFDVGGDRAWGPSYGRESLPAWAADAVSSPIGAAPMTTTTSSMGAEPPVMIRDSEGNLKPRLYSPLSGPILQAYNAAAGVAYLSEVLVKGETDMMGLSQQFETNPEGFRGAAQAYVDDLVKQAPDMFRQDVRASLEKEAQRRFLGMMEEKHTDIRRRAVNSNQAVIDMRERSYIAALTSGDPTETAAAFDEYQQALRVKETLPGLAWTEEQSVNAIALARERAQAELLKQTTARNTELKNQLKIVQDAAAAGETSEFDHLLNDPNIRAALPMEVANAEAQVAAREFLRPLKVLPKAERDARVREFTDGPVGSQQEIAAREAVRTQNAQITQDFKDSPIDAAQKYLPMKPPPMPPMDAPPEQIVEALAARRKYGDMIVEMGMAPEAAYLSKDEVAGLNKLFAKEIPVQLRLAAAMQIAEGFGDATGRVFNALNVDPVTRSAGAMVAAGVSPEIAEQAMLGRAALDAKAVKDNFNAASLQVAAPDIWPALQGIGPIRGAENDLIEVARAIYAHDNPEEPTTKEKRAEAMTAAVQKALGQSKSVTGNTIGGVQQVFNQPVLLPVDVTAEDVQTAMLARDQYSPGERFAMVTGYDRPLDPARWGAAGVASSAGSLPMIGGNTVDPGLIGKGSVRIKPMPSSGPNVYALEYVSDSGATVEARDASGMVYQFDLKKLIGAAQ